MFTGAFHRNYNRNKVDWVTTFALLFLKQLELFQTLATLAAEPLGPMVVFDCRGLTLL